VMRLIQEGKEVPGVKKLDIQPSNQSPTPSQMVRILKPWETASENMQTPCRKIPGKPGREPGIFLLQGESANHYATVQPC
uniref:Peroxisomal membrane protein PEX14-like KPWE domain-containing protein n=1 Tax=Amphiprion ocellaris TaxID=80972 RepID=A0A3Q1BW31_AMPOC